MVQHDEHLISEYDHEGTELSRQVKGIRRPHVPIVDPQDTLFVLTDGAGQGMWEVESG